MFADQQAELISQPGLTIGRAISILAFLSIRGFRLRRSGRPPKFLDSLAKGPVNDAHLNAAHERRHIGWIGISETNESA
jgi:hypothetical protein